MEQELVFSKRYNEIIDAAKKRGWTKKYCKENNIKAQGHHIKPKCVYPELAKSRSNIVYLTGAEHVEAHYELAINNEWCDGLVYAFNTQFQTQTEVSKESFKRAGMLLEKAATLISANKTKLFDINTEEGRAARKNLSIKTSARFDINTEEGRAARNGLSKATTKQFDINTAEGIAYIEADRQSTLKQFDKNTEQGRKNLQHHRDINIRHYGIVCINTKEFFECCKDAERKYNINAGDILNCCKGKNKSGKNIRSAGKINNKKAMWRFATEEEIKIKDYINTNDNNVFINSTNYIVVCINTGEIFTSALEAGTKYNIKSYSIGYCCKGKDSRGCARTTAGVLNGEKLKWRFATEEEIEKLKKGELTYELA